MTILFFCIQLNKIIYVCSQFPRGNTDFYLELVNEKVTDVCKGMYIEIT